MAGKKYQIMVIDPRNSKTETSSGATCELKRPALIGVDTSQKQAIHITDSHIIDAHDQKSFSEPARTTSVEKETKRTGTVQEGAIENFLKEYNPFTRYMDKPDNPVQPSKAQAIYATNLENAGIACTKDGKKVAPLLKPDDLIKMGNKAKQKIILDPPELPI